MASEQLVLYSVNDGAARERLHMGRVFGETFGSYPINARTAMEGLGLKKDDV